MLDGAGGVSTEGLGYDAAVCSPVVVARPARSCTCWPRTSGTTEQAVTRFVLVGPPGRPDAPPPPEQTSAWWCRCGRSRPGRCFDILEQFATRGVNLTRIESRPAKTHLGDYFFSVDIDGRVQDDRVADALMGVRDLPHPVPRVVPRADHSWSRGLAPQRRRVRPGPFVRWSKPEGQ
ncbi:hypothetical protein QJS66_10180 [Kocuria rhizophila]|nr:hypothetical protein QJS66_10180 [Kocuria rhizophila]